MAISLVRLTTALYRRAFCQVRVSPFNGFSTWRRSSPMQLFDNSAAAASAARTEAPQNQADASECAGGASGHAAHSKTRPPQELQPRARARSSDGKPTSARVLAGAIVNPVKNAGCECGRGRGRISGERRTLNLSCKCHGQEQAAEAASLVSDGHHVDAGHRHRDLRGRGRISGERRTPPVGVAVVALYAGGRGRISGERRTPPGRSPISTEGGAAEAASLVSDGHRQDVGNPAATEGGRGRISGERRTPEYGATITAPASGGRGRISGERRTHGAGLSEGRGVRRPRPHLW
jgi:hypothetical protein